MERRYGQKGDRKGLVSDQEVLPSKSSFSTFFNTLLENQKLCPKTQFSEKIQNSRIFEQKWQDFRDFFKVKIT